jgi:subtilisin family serine protease
VLRPALGPASTAFWGLSGVGSLVAVPVAFQLVDDPALTALAGGVDPYVLLGVAGTLAALAVVAHARRHPRIAGTDASLRGILTDGARETSTVVVGVAAAYLVWGVLRAVTGFDGTQLALAGAVGVLLGAGIGLIPGCAVQIAFTSLYLAGAMPLSTLVANALSQDGDALLPLIPLDRRGALLATVVTTVPGLLVGALFLFTRWNL